MLKPKEETAKFKSLKLPKTSSPLLFLFTFLLACSSQQIIHYVEPIDSFKGIQSYELVSSLSSSDKNIPKSDLSIIWSNIDAALKERGYSKSQTNDSDVIVRFELIGSSDQNIQTSGFSPYTNYYSATGRPYVWTQTTLESIFLIEMHHRKSKRLLWQASKDVNTSISNSEKDDLIKATIEDLFTTLPTLPAN